MYYWRLISPVFAIITITLLFSINTIYGMTDKLQADPSPRAGAIAAIDTEYFRTDTGSSVMPETALSIDARSLPEEGFLRRNEGTLIGSFLAAFIALSAVLLTKLITDRSHRKREELKDRTIHDNILTAAKSELDQHKDILLLNMEKWEECTLEKTGVIKESVLKGLSFSLPLDFLSFLREKLLEAGSLQISDIVEISKYIGSCRTLNSHLEFHLIQAPDIKVGVSNANFGDFKNDLLAKISSQLESISSIHDTLI